MASKAERKQARSLAREQADGTVVELRQVKTGTQAVSTQKWRSRSGSFDWKYGRLKADDRKRPLFEAGTDFCRLWERAGIASTGNPLAAIGRGSGATSAGMSDARCEAVDEVRRITERLGGPITRRLVSYCVEGKTTREIGDMYVTDERRMAHVLAVDLAELAREMNYGRIDLRNEVP